MVACTLVVVVLVILLLLQIKFLPDLEQVKVILLTTLVRPIFEHFAFIFADAVSPGDMQLDVMVAANIASDAKARPNLVTFIY